MADGQDIPSFLDASVIYGGKLTFHETPTMADKGQWIARKVWPGSGEWDIKKDLVGGILDPRRHDYDIAGNINFGAIRGRKIFLA